MRAFVISVVALSLTACGASDGDDAHKTAAKTWAAVGGDWSNSHYSTLTQLTPANVKDLGAVWTMKFPEENSRATPVVIGGRMSMP